MSKTKGDENVTVTKPKRRRTAVRWFWFLHRLWEKFYLLLRQHRIKSVFSSAVLLMIMVVGIAQAQVPSNTLAVDSPALTKLFSDRKADINGVQIHYVIGGNGPPVVLLHGFLTTWYEWRHIMPDLAKTHTVIVPDIRGLGDSSKPLDGYDKKTAAEDVYALLRKLGYQRFDLVGHDIGGMLVYSLAAIHRDAVRRLVLVDAVQPGIPPWDELVQAPRSWHFRFFNVPDLPEMLMAGHEQQFIAWFFNSQAFRSNALTNATLDVYTRAYLMPGAWRSAFNYYRVFPQDVKDNAELAQTKLSIPVLVVGGSESGLTSRMKAMYPNVATNISFQVVPNSGHWIPDEQPAALLSVLQTFLDKL